MHTHAYVHNNMIIDQWCVSSCEMDFNHVQFHPGFLFNTSLQCIKEDKQTSLQTETEQEH